MYGFILCCFEEIWYGIDWTPIFSLIFRTILNGDILKFPLSTVRIVSKCAWPAGGATKVQSWTTEFRLSEEKAADLLMSLVDNNTYWLGWICCRQTAYSFVVVVMLNSFSTISLVTDAVQPLVIFFFLIYCVW